MNKKLSVNDRPPKVISFRMACVQQNQKITLSNFHAEVQRSIGYEPDEIPLVLDSFAVQDLDGDHSKELVLELGDNRYLILHRDGNTFFGIDLAVCGFRCLQKNGIYSGTGGPGLNTIYEQMIFQSGTFVEKELAHQIMAGTSGDEPAAEYVIDGQNTTAAEFEVWKEDHLIGEVT